MATATDRLLATVLRAYQTTHDLEQTNKILSTTTSLFTTLSNPLNVTILTSQLLTAPAIWSQVDGTRTFLRIVSIFNTAAIAVRQHELDGRRNGQSGHGGGIRSDDWARAVVKGADDRSPRWRHLLAIGGVLLGMEGQQRQGLSGTLRTTLEGALVDAANLALAVPTRDDVLGSGAVVLSLSHTFDLLSAGLKRRLNYNLLAPIAIHAMTGPEGYQDGSFLGAADLDVRQVPGNKFDWSPKSPSFLQLQKVASKPLISAIGPLSRLAAHALSKMANPGQMPAFLDHMTAFTLMLAKQWRQNKLSELEPSEEEAFLTPETMTVTFPVLWQVLKTIMFATVNILRAVIGRSLIDTALVAEASACSIASRTLHILRNIYFISSRFGSNTFSAYNFTFLTSIDILMHFPDQSKIFLTQIRSNQPGDIPPHPLDRNLDLFFLNTCEHFTLILNPQDNESLIVAAASPYLNPGAHKNLLEIFEAAHSAMLAVLAAAQNTTLTTKIIPFYIEALFRSFPTNLSPRQFRFAFKTLLQITTPPAPLSESQPFLPDTLLELLHHRATHAPTSPLPAALVLKSDADALSNNKQPPLSEQAVLTLILLDALPFLPYRSLEEWLPLAAELLNCIHDNRMRGVCKSRFWEVLESGEMDVDRAAICVAWWSTRGGREMVLFGKEKHGVAEGPFMSGGLQVPEDAGRL